MKKSTARGFTLVELLVVIAIVAILSVVAVPTFARQIEKANISVDSSLVYNLNSSLKLEGLFHEDSPITAYEAIDSIKDNFPSDKTIKTKTKGYVIAWDSRLNQFVLINDKNNAVFPEYNSLDNNSLWVINDSHNTYYENLGFNEYIKSDYSGDTITTTRGIDTGYNETLSVIYQGDTPNTIIRLNGGSLTVNNENADLSLYGRCDDVNVIACKNESLYLHAQVNTLSISKGKVVVEKSGSIVSEEIQIATETYEDVTVVYRKENKNYGLLSLGNETINNLFTINIINERDEIIGSGNCEHEWTNINVISPTCTEQGYTTKHCSSCGYDYVGDYVEALGHAIVHHDAQTVTCTEIGWEAYDTCSRCDYSTYEVIEALGHNYSSAVTAPTCTAQGYTTHICTRCGDSYVDTYVDATGHTEVIDLAVAPTCTESGLTQGKHCSVCNAVLVAQQVVTATGHTPAAPVFDNVINPTCTEDGSHDEVVYCSVCNAEISRQHVIDDALGHAIVHHEAQATTSVTEGWNAYDTCTRCDYSTYTAIPTYTYCQINDVAKSYIDEVTYTSTGPSQMPSYYNIETSYNKQRPFGYTVDLVAGNLTVIDNDTGNYYTVTVNAGPYTFYNLTPGVGGEFAVRDSNSNILQQGHLRPTGELRMIYTEGTWNARDLGGWECDGGTVKYNMLIRGGNPIGLTQWDKDTWVKLIGIDNDLFLAEDNNYPTDSSPIGSGITFQRTTLRDETKDNAYETWESARLNGKAALIFNNIMDNAIAGKTTYFHCLAGADRTGMTAYVIEAVLGMSESDIDKDYELTSFYALRKRIDSFVQFLSDRYDGETLRDRAVNYLLACGISMNKINAFRNAMIDGTPEQLVDINELERVDIVMNFEHIVSNNTVGAQYTTNPGNSYATTSNVMNATYGETYTLSLSEEYEGSSVGTLQFVFYGVDGTITEVSKLTYLYNGETLRYKTKNPNTAYVAIRSHGDINVHNVYLTLRGPNSVVQESPLPIQNTKTLTFNLSNCTSDTSITELQIKQGLTINLSAVSGYVLSPDNITVLMGGNNISLSSVNGNQIHINKVLGDIVINATAISEIIYNDIGSITSDNNFADTNSSDWKVNMKGSFSAKIANDGIASATGYIVTNKISVQYNDIIFVKGLNLGNASNYYSNVYFPTGDGYMPDYPTVPTNGSFRDNGASGEWTYFTINIENATGLRLCATIPTNLNNVVICIYRDGKWLDNSTPAPETPLETALSTISSITYDNNFADPNSSDWKTNSRGSGSKEIDTLSGHILTNKISVQNGDVVFIKGLVIPNNNNYYSLLYTTSHNVFYPETNTTYICDYGTYEGWVYFTVNIATATGIRICSINPTDIDEVSICIYRNGAWVEIPELNEDTPLAIALSTINTTSSSNNFANPNCSDWKSDSRGSGSAGIAADGIGAGTGRILTNKIAVQYDDIIFVKGLTIQDVKSYYSLVYFPTGNCYQIDLPTNPINGAFKDAGISGDWTYFAINIANATDMRICATTPSNTDGIEICIYRPNLGWLSK